MLRDKGQKTPSHLFQLLLTELNFLAQGHNPAAPTTEMGKKEEVYGLERQEQKPMCPPPLRPAGWWQKSIAALTLLLLAQTLPPSLYQLQELVLRAGPAGQLEVSSLQHSKQRGSGPVLTVSG